MFHLGHSLYQTNLLYTLKETVCQMIPWQILLVPPPFLMSRPLQTCKTWMSWLGQRLLPTGRRWPSGWEWRAVLEESFSRTTPTIVSRHVQLLVGKGSAHWWRSSVVIHTLNSSGYNRLCRAGEETAETALSQVISTTSFIVRTSTALFMYIFMITCTILYLHDGTLWLSFVCYVMCRINFVHLYI